MSEENGNQIPSADAIQGIIGTLMSNPELMKNIIGMLGNQNGEDDGIGEEEVAEESAAENSAAEEAAISTPSVPSVPPELISKLPMLLSLLGGSSAPKSKREAEREALLSAMKPFLSPSRAESIEKIIKISRLGDILTSL
jgi:hypothetical protein